MLKIPRSNKYRKQTARSIGEHAMPARLEVKCSRKALLDGSDNIQVRSEVARESGSNARDSYLDRGFLSSREPVVLRRASRQ